MSPLKFPALSVLEKYFLPFQLIKLWNLKNKIFYLFVNVCIFTMEASTAEAIPGKLGGDAPLHRAVIHGYSFRGSVPGVDPWEPK